MVRIMCPRVYLKSIYRFIPLFFKCYFKTIKTYLCKELTLSENMKGATIELNIGQRIINGDLLYFFAFTFKCSSHMQIAGIRFKLRSLNAFKLLTFSIYVKTTFLFCTDLVPRAEAVDNLYLLSQCGWLSIIH